MQLNGPNPNLTLTFAVASSEPLTSSGGPRFSGQQLFTKLSCSDIFFTCTAASGRSGSAAGEMRL